MSTSQQVLKNVDLPKKYTRCVFDNAELLLLSQLYSKVTTWELGNQSMHMSAIFKKYMSVTVGGKKFSASCVCHDPIVCLARWNESMLGRMPGGDAWISTVTHDPFVRPVIIHYIAVHRVSSTSQPVQAYEKVVIRVSWLSSCRDLFCFGKPLQSWCCDDFLPGGVHSFIPVDSLYDLCVYSYQVINKSQVLLIMTLR